MRRCPNCDAGVGNHANYCWRCGEEIRISHDDPLKEFENITLPAFAIAFCLTLYKVWDSSALFTSFMTAALAGLAAYYLIIPAIIIGVIYLITVVYNYIN